MPNKIDKALTAWSVEKDVTEYLKQSLGLKSASGKKHIDDIIDNAINKAKVEDKPEWTNLLLNSIKVDKVKDVSSQTNIFMTANAVADETIRKLVDVTPPVEKKNKIEELI